MPSWHIKKVNQLEVEQNRLSIWIWIAGGAGTVLAGVGSSIPAYSSLTLWVPVTAAIASALMGWEELRNLDTTIKNYSKVILELMRCKLDGSSSYEYPLAMRRKALYEMLNYYRVLFDHFKDLESLHVLEATFHD